MTPAGEGRGACEGSQFAPAPRRAQKPAAIASHSGRTFVCRDCGRQFSVPARLGRPPSRCDECKRSRAGARRATSKGLAPQAGLLDVAALTVRWRLTRKGVYWRLREWKAAVRQVPNPRPGHGPRKILAIEETEANRIEALCAMGRDVPACVPPKERQAEPAPLPAPVPTAPPEPTPTAKVAPPAPARRSPPAAPIAANAAAGRPERPRLPRHAPGRKLTLADLAEWASLADVASATRLAATEILRMRRRGILEARSGLSGIEISRTSVEAMARRYRLGTANRVVGGRAATSEGEPPRREREPATDEVPELDFALCTEET